jgi:hypothetical protein
MDKNFINPNRATAQDRLENYIAGQKMLKGMNVTNTEIGNVQSLTSARRKAQKKGSLHNPIVPNMADYTNWILYDRIVFAAGSNIPTNFKLFVVPIGQSSKTKVDTNLDLVSQLPQPYWFNATHIGFNWYFNVLELDLVNFLAQSYMEFWVNNKIYSEGPYQAYPANVGASGFSTQTNQSVLTNGWNTGVQTMYDLRLPAGINLGKDPSTGAPVVTDGLTGINILQSQLFKIENYLPGGVLALTASTAEPNAGTGLTLQVFLHGVLSRSVQ